MGQRGLTSHHRSTMLTSIIRHRIDVLAELSYYQTKLIRISYRRGDWVYNVIDPSNMKSRIVLELRARTTKL